MNKQAFSHMWSAVLLILLVFSMSLTGCRPTRQPIVQTVVVEKEKIVEKPVVETVVVQTEKIVEKPVIQTVVVEEKTEKPTGTLIIGWEGDPERFVTTVWTVASNVPLHELLYDSLVELAPDFSFQPRLAKGWEFSEDGRTVTFHLRDDVKFTDGKPLTAEDVSFTYHLCGYPGVSTGEASFVDYLEGYDEYREGKADTISGIKVIDDYTISFTSQEPYAPMMTYMNKGIMPKHLLKDVPVADLGVHEFNFHPVGSGPFKLQEYVPNRHVIMTANEDYFRGSPKVERVIFRIASHEALLASWLREEIDAAPVPVAELAAVEDSGFGYIHAFSGGRIDYIGPNCAGKFFQDARVRRAVSLALDRQVLVDLVLDGRGIPLILPNLPDTWAYDTKKWPAPARDLETAGQLMDEAGWKLNPTTGIREKDGQPFAVELWYVTDREPFLPDLAALIQAQLADLGMSVKLRAFDSPSIWPILLPREKVPDPDKFYDFALLGTTLSDGDPNWLWYYIHGDAIPPVSGNNQLYSNPVMNQLLDQQKGIMDPVERQNFWNEKIWPLYLEEMPMIPVLVPQQFWAINYRFQGFNPQINSRVNNALNWSVSD